MSILLFIFSTVFIGIFSFYLWRWTYWRRRGIPGPLGYPFIGCSLTMLDTVNHPYCQLREWTKKYGKVFGMTEGLSKVLVISDPVLVQEVFVKQYDNFYGRKLNTMQADPENDTLVNVFFAHGHRWKRLRTISSPTFSNNNLRKLKNTVEEVVVELMRHIETETVGGNQIDMLIFYQEFTLEVIGRIAMGETESLMFRNPLFEMIRSIFVSPPRFLFLISYVIPWIGPKIKKISMMFPEFCNNPAILIVRKVRKAIEDRIEQRKKTDVETHDFIDLLLDARAPDDVEIFKEGNEDYTKGGVKVTRQLTNDEIIAQLAVFLVAGFDTTALSLSFTSYLLATHPKIMKKVREEIDRECPDPQITFDQLSHLKYMEMVIKETLRMYPLGAFVNARRCMRSTKIGKYEVEEGVDVLCDTWTLHYDPNIWGEDAEEFKPERWENGEENFYKGGYIPFGLGPRQCIGIRLAYMEEKLLLSHILRKYHFVTGPKTQIPMKLMGMRTTQPESVWLHLKLRD